jgi:hypothetical protein
MGAVNDCDAVSRASHHSAHGLAYPAVAPNNSAPSGYQIMSAAASGSTLTPHWELCRR